MYGIWKLFWGLVSIDPKLILETVFWESITVLGARYLDVQKTCLMAFSCEAIDSPVFYQYQEEALMPRRFSLWSLDVRP